MAVKLYLENAIGRPGCVLKNGTGGSAPDLDENPDWPTRWTLIRDRSLSWRAQAGGLGPHGGTYLFDYDFGSAVGISAAGFLDLRCYPLGVIPASLSIEAYHGASYPPGTAVSLALAATNSDNLKEFTLASDRYWRVQVTALDGGGAPLEISGRPWLVENASIFTFKNPRPGSRVTTSRIREEVMTPAGVVFHADPVGQLRGSIARAVSLNCGVDDGTMVGYVRDTIGTRSERVVILDYEGGYIETTLPEGEADWERVFLTASRLVAPFAGQP